CKPLVNTKCPSSNAPVALNRSNTAVVSNSHLGRTNACYNPPLMPPFANLISDSTLVQETIELLRDCGGRANAAEIVDAVFKVSHIDEELAALLIADLVKGDRRFKLVDGKTIELQEDDVETRLLQDLNFVVVD